MASAQAVGTFALMVALTLALIAAGAPQRASADGDPASDVLVSEPLFLPADAHLSPQQQAQLGALLAESAHSGYPLRVALIASPSDLGSVTELWRQPQAYAEFLGEELSLIARGPLLVMMPDGFGLYGIPAPVAARASLNRLRAPTAQGSFGPTALSAIRELATAAGHPLGVPHAGASSSPSSFDPLPWLVFALGCGLIAAAWTASLRARPARLSRG